MNLAIHIEVSGEAQEVLRRLSDGRVLGAVGAAMDRENQFTIAHISAVRMRGNDGKPFDAGLHVLGIRTNRYRSSLRNSKAVVSGSQVESAIGSNVKYAGIHEFGGTIKVGARKGVARLRTDRSGGLMRQVGHGNLAVFARGGHKRVKAVPYVAPAHEIQMPERAPVRSGIEDRARDYGSAVSGAIVNFWAGNKS